MYQIFDETICAPATIPGSGAIAIIRVSGNESMAIADKIVSLKGASLSETEGYRLRYGSIFTEDGNLLDNVVVSVFRAPHSYTGENSVEISCHASTFIVNAILELLVKAGARIASPGEFTRRAFVNGKMDLAQAEAVADVIASRSAAAHRVAMNQLKGGFSEELKKLRGELLKMTSLLELELDFSEEDVEFASRKELCALVDAALEHINRLKDSFSRGNAIRNGVPVVIAGATNTGKSTLLNALLGEERAIVSDVAGTTRDTVEETLNIGGVLFRFIDTAGIRETDEVVEKIGIERTFKKMNEAEIVLGMTDLSRGEDAVLEEAEYISRMLRMTEQIEADDRSSKVKYDVKDNGEKKFVLLVNKFDSVTEEVSGMSPYNKDVCTENGIVSRLIDKGFTNKILPISAKTGWGLDELRKTLAELGRKITGDGDETLVTNIRHYEALAKASTALARVRSGLGGGVGGGLGGRVGGRLSDGVGSDGDGVGGGLSGGVGGGLSDGLGDGLHYGSQPLPPDLVAQDLREALYHLGEIVGEISTDEVLGSIFSHFCIGK